MKKFEYSVHGEARFREDVKEFQHRLVTTWWWKEEEDVVVLK